LPTVFEGDYKELTKKRIATYAEIDGKQAGDPRKAVKAMIKVVEADDPPLRLLLGKDAYEWANEELESMKRDFEAWKDVTLSTDFEESRV
ncbi:MAG TPA: hypothetical protein VNI20_10475, partial [Fimbriimonadaceae bacterium]|nr:hypothetical protein [Fimbriimonadaceae bacterium]